MKINLKFIFVITILKFYVVNCSVLLWSEKRFEIRPLERFTDDEFSILLEKMDYPDVTAYSYPNRDLPFKFKELLDGSFSAYNNNEDLVTINTTDLSGDEVRDFAQIKSDIETSKKESHNRLFLIISANQRLKREIEDGESTRTTTEDKGPVIYIGKSIANEKYGLIYSSSALLLKMNKTETYLGETSEDMVSVDTVARESITRLNVKFPQEKITFRFIFIWIDSYWYLKSVRMSDTSLNVAYNLTIDKEVAAPSKFSYHCSGLTTFSDTTNDVYLYLTNMQVQIDSKRENFGDAYDCISFTTIPIWTGVFVSLLLIVVLLLSVIALVDIKTMDKFDNHKTKQLVITVIE